MLKTRADFNSEDEYMTYTKTSEFLLAYSWEGKDKETIIREMALPDFEQEYLDKALEHLSKEKDYTGMALDRLIYLLMDLDEPEDDFDPDNVVFIEREWS